MLLQPLFKRGQRVRVINHGVDRFGHEPRVVAHNNYFGRVTRVEGPMVPAQVSTGQTAPATWTWFSYDVEMDDGYRFNGISQLDLCEK